VTRGAAEFSACGKYRYWLSRTWADHDGARWRLSNDLWVLLNPSYAGADTDDQTVRKVVEFSRRNGAGALVIVNPNAYIATDPKELQAARDHGVDVCGPGNKSAIVDCLLWCDRVICGWGAGIAPEDKKWIGIQLATHRRPAFCLGTTASGEPRHPLRLAYNTPLVPYTLITEM